MTRYAVLFSALAAAAVSQTPARLHAELDDRQTFVLKGNVRPAVAQGLAQDQGEAPGSQPLPRISLHFALTANQRADLAALLAAQQNPASPQFHKFLTPEEYAARFGLNDADIQTVALWLSNNGFSNLEIARSRTWVSFSGTAGQVEAAFHTSIHNYSLNGETHFANSTDPELPAALQGVVESIRGLHNFRLKPHIRTRPRFTSSLSGNTFLAPDDWETIYDVKPLYSQGYDGSNVSIAVVGQSDVQLSDLAAFRSAAGLPAKSPTVTVVGADPGTVSSDEGESDLDLEWSGAIARNANILFITSQNVDDSVTYAIDNNVAPILTTSYGLCEIDTGSSEVASENSQFAQANAQGMTIVAAAGDAGAADCDTSYPARHGLAVDFPASSQYVTGVGGTELTASSAGAYWGSSNNGYNGSALQYIPETVWNDSNSTNGLEAGGGGASIYITKPSWQTGTGVPNDGARDVPDIALAASPNTDGLLYCGHNWCTSGFRDASQDLDVIGGTSAGAPTFAGVLALLVEKTGSRLGNVNPTLYALAASHASAFHDITSGNNIVACRAASTNCPTSDQYGYSAATGYDLASGLGSIDAYILATYWSSATGSSGASLQFVPVTPCRLVDTRLVGGALVGGTERNFTVAGNCAIPSTAAAYSLNVTAVPNGALGYLTLWPTGSSQPLVSTLNSDGRVKANAAIVPAGANGAVSVYVSDASNVILDINGYFISADSAALDFFPLTPCRIVDTRSSGPSLSAGGTRAFTIAGNCSVPSGAQAYSLNFTAVPHAGLSFLTTWPAGEAQPTVSTLNAPTGAVTANAALLPAGTGGAVNVYASDNTDLIIDVNGYFAAQASGGLSLYTLTPCRVLDTRTASGVFSGALNVSVSGSSCGAPSSAGSYVLNATVIPSGGLGYLTLGATGQAQPFVSTLNSDGSITSNMAIVPAASGSVTAYASDPTQLILDVSGYFAP